MDTPIESSSPVGTEAAEEAVIVAEGLGKVYQLYAKPIQRLFDLCLPGGPRFKPFWALRDVSLSLPRRTTIGIIGENGAGKSTLLKLLSGITNPSEGSVSVKGRVTSLIELGAGFHPDFTGRENIGLSCSILGMGEKEIAERTEAIIEFAELGTFIDRPVKTYSSGMHVRLGFSVATCVEPDVLLIDEALSVGDEYFKGKCMDRLNRFRDAGGTVVFVSHDMGAVKTICQHVIYLDGGKLVEQGSAEKVADVYLKRAQARSKQQIEGEGIPESSYPRWGSGEILVEDVEVLGEGGERTQVFRTGEPFSVRLGYRARETVQQPVFGVGLYRADGTYINGCNHLWNEHPLEIECIQKGETGALRMELGPLPLLEGRYYITAFLYDHSKPSPTPIDHREHAIGFQVMDAQSHQHGLMTLPAKWSFEPNKGGAEQEQG